MQRVEVVVADLREEFRIVSELWHHEQTTQSIEASLSIRQDIVCYLNRIGATRIGATVGDVPADQLVAFTDCAIGTRQDGLVASLHRTNLFVTEVFGPLALNAQIELEVTGVCQVVDDELGSAVACHVELGGLGVERHENAADKTFSAVYVGVARMTMCTRIEERRIGHNDLARGNAVDHFGVQEGDVLLAVDDVVFDGVGRSTFSCLEVDTQQQRAIAQNDAGEDLVRMIDVVITQWCEHAQIPFRNGLACVCHDLKREPGVGVEAVAVVVATVVRGVVEVGDLVVRLVGIRDGNRPAFDRNERVRVSCVVHA